MSIKMNPEIKYKKMAALRSGEYEQTAGSLIDLNGFYCLGVLCDVFHKETGKWVNRDNEWVFLLNGKAADQYTHDDVARWAGFRIINARFNMINNYASTNLALQNDYGKSFEEIADL